jgi:hypothetical protein
MFSTYRNAVAVAPNPWKVPTNTEAPESVKRSPSRGAFLLGVLSSAALVATFLAIGSSASAANTPNQWKLGAYTANGGYGFKSAPMGTFAFPLLPAVNSGGAAPSLLLNNTGTLVGNLTGKTITATFTISGVSSAAAFTYGGEPDGSGIAANARLYWDSASIIKGKTQVATNYWWSNPENVTLAANGTGFSLTATIDPGSWSDYYGALGSQDQSTMSAFNAAATNVKDIGFSFGGGYFFSNGVGTTDGSGTFTETSFTVG